LSESISRHFFKMYIHRFLILDNTFLIIVLGCIALSLTALRQGSDRHVTQTGTSHRQARHTDTAQTALRQTGLRQARHTDSAQTALRQARHTDAVTCRTYSAGVSAALGGLLGWGQWGVQGSNSQTLPG